MPGPDRSVVGWDIGGAHVKACLLRRGEVVDVAQWACPLWQGLEHLSGVLKAARVRWPELGSADHAVTMTGEMVDLFEHREDGVRRIAAVLQKALGQATGSSRAAAVHFYAGESGWCSSGDVAACWEQIASANWLATGRHAAQVLGAGVLLDIGSTTTDLIAFQGGRVLTRSRTDAQRLAGSELVYHGVVRTPLCALAQRIEWRGRACNVMNELFATTADVYRLTGELDPLHDLHPSADNGAKDLPATRQRLARMIGLDQRDGDVGEWLAYARAWRAAQVGVLGAELRRVLAAHDLGPAAVAVSAGCGDFLVADVLASASAATSGASSTANANPTAAAAADPTAGATSNAADRQVATAAGPGRRIVAYGREIARVAHTVPDRGAVQAWAQVCAPSVATATLFDRDRR